MGSLPKIIYLIKNQIIFDFFIYRCYYLPMDHVHYKDDSGLVERCICRDTSAWDTLLKKYSALIRNAIYNRARKYGVSLPIHDIDDIAQDVLAAIWEGNKLSTIKNRKDISCWLAIVSGNAAAEYLRSRRPAETLNEEEAVYACTPPDKETLSEIEKAIEKLPPRERLIIQLNLFHDKKYREIADMLNIPEGTVSSYIKRSKDRLKNKLKFLQ